MDVTDRRIDAQRFCRRYMDKESTFFCLLLRSNVHSTFDYLLEKVHLVDRLVSPMSVMFGENIFYRVACVLLNALMMSKRVKAKNHSRATCFESMENEDASSYSINLVKCENVSHPAKKKTKA